MLQMPSNIKIFQIIVLALVLILIIYFSIFSAPEEKSKEAIPDKAEVILTDKGFVPDEVFIKVNGTVTFSTNRDKPLWPASNSHPNHGIYPEFDPKRPIGLQERWTFQFNRVGEWKYHDHLRSYFSGTIRVVK